MSSPILSHFLERNNNKYFSVAKGELLPSRGCGIRVGGEVGSALPTETSTQIVRVTIIGEHKWEGHTFSLRSAGNLSTLERSHSTQIAFHTYAGQSICSYIVDASSQLVR